MRVMFKEPGKRPEEREISGDLEGMQRAVDGYIETLSLPYLDLVIVMDEEARIKGKERNIIIPRMMLQSIIPVGIVGDLFVCVAEGDELRGLNDAEMEAAKSILEVCSLGTEV